MDRVYFITPEKLTQYGFIHSNVEPDILINCIFRAQETQIQPVLGTPLYISLKDKVDAGLTTGVYFELMVNYVIPALIPLVEILATFHTTTEIENKGTGKNKDEHFTAGTIAENNNLRDQLKKDASHFENQLIRHLCDDNGTNFPEYVERTGLKEDFKPEKSGPDYESKIFIM